MRTVPLCDLPKWSPWPKRLLGLAPWEKPRRGIEKIDLEYDKVKYAACLDYVSGRDAGVTLEDVKQFELGLPLNQAVCVSIGDDLYEMTLGEAREHHLRTIVDAVAGALPRCATVVELGCGYGYNLSHIQRRFPEKTVTGGEYSENAIRIAQQLNLGASGVSLRKFDFCDPSSYAMLDSLPAPLLILTVHALEQLPNSDQVFDSLTRLREKIGAVIHLEPVVGLHNDSLLGMLRKRYAELNDYNQDLLRQIVDRAGLAFVRREANVFGLNPLNPTSIVEWRFG
jgi:SAM-dependent methyltransferase